MEFWVGVTDNNWYEYLNKLKPDEVNFWQPSGTPPFKKQIELFLFKLHSPLNYIAGGGYFVTYTGLPISLAWDTFGQKNGVSNYSDFRSTVLNYRESHGKFHGIDPEIGCSILAQPFFFKREDWIPVPEDWKLNIVRGKMYDSQKETGARLLEEVKKRLVHHNETLNSSTILANPHESASNRYGSEYLVRARIGQGSFRVLVTDAYTRKCAMTGEKTLPALEAAHMALLEFRWQSYNRLHSIVY